MRYAELLVLLPITLATGCSALIANTGHDLTTLENRRQVRAQFGEPSHVGTKDGMQYDEFRSRRKYAERDRSGDLAMRVVMSLYWPEIYCFPREMYWLTKQVVVGQTIRVRYDDTGYVVAIEMDGRSLWYWNRKREPRTVEADIPGHAK